MRALHALHELRSAAVRSRYLRDDRQTNTPWPGVVALEDRERKNGSNARTRTSAERPGPSSMTSNVTVSAVSARRTRTGASPEYFNALSYPLLEGPAFA